LRKNGCGKTTLFLAAQLACCGPNTAGFAWRGEPIAYQRQAPTQLRQTVGLLFQNPGGTSSVATSTGVSRRPLHGLVSTWDGRQRISSGGVTCMSIGFPHFPISKSLDEIRPKCTGQRCAVEKATPAADVIGMLRS